MSRKTLRNLAKAAAGICLSIALSYLINHLLQQHYRKITISRETTYVLGPTFPDGYVDFLSALDSQFSAGVTPQNNAAIPLFQAIGLKDTIIQRDRPHILAALQMPDLPDNATYFTHAYQILFQKAKATAPKGKYIDESDFYSASEDIETAHTRAPWTAADDPIAAQWLQINASALKLAIQASNLPRFYVPFSGRRDLGTTIGAGLPSLSLHRALANALATRANLALANHDFPSWREDLLAQQRLGRLLMQAPTLIHYLVGRAIIDQANASIAGALPYLNAAQARQVLNDLRALPPPPDIIDCADHAERLMIIAEVSTMARFGPADIDRSGSDSTPLPAPASFGFNHPIHFDDLLRQYNHQIDLYVAASHAPTYSQRTATLNRLNSDVASAMAKLSSNDPVDAIQKLLLGGADPFRDMSQHQDKFHQSARLTQLALLLHIYHADHNAYPAQLSDLPDLQNTNLDIFADNAPVHYVPTPADCLIYSIGPNQRDDAGKLVKPKTNPRATFNLGDPPAPEPDHPDDIALHLKP